MHKFEDKASGDDLLKNGQEEGKLEDKESVGAEDRKEEASQEELGKTLGEIKDSVENINETLNEAKSIESELESQDQREKYF